MMALGRTIFDALDESQDNNPLTKYMRQRAETMLGEYELPVTDCLNELIVRCWELAEDPTDSYNDLRYAARELNRAADALRVFMDTEEA
jgi:hypothetical protein